MKVENLYDKNICDECDEYTETFGIYIKGEEYPVLKLCKKCLLTLLTAIVER